MLCLCVAAFLSFNFMFYSVLFLHLCPKIKCNKNRKRTPCDCQGCASSDFHWPLNIIYKNSSSGWAPNTEINRTNEWWREAREKKKEKVVTKRRAKNKTDWNKNNRIKSKIIKHIYCVEHFVYVRWNVKRSRASWIWKTRTNSMRHIADKK